MRTLLSVVLCLQLAGLAASSGNATEVTFTFQPTTDIKSVSVRGSFNSWGETPMQKAADGVWSVTVDVQPGSISYKYFVDGQWPSDMSAGLDGGPMDPAAEKYEDDGYGGKNAVRVIAGKVAPFMAVAPAPALKKDHVRINYHRPDGNYRPDNSITWGLHVWEDTSADVAWDRPLKPAGLSEYGLYWDVPLRPDPGKLGFIIHHGDTKDHPGDNFLNLADGTREIWVVAENSKLFTEQPDLDALPVGDLDLARAHWVSANTIVWPGLPSGAACTLHHEPAGKLELTGKGVAGGQSLELQPAGKYTAPGGLFPHLAGAPAFTVAGIDAASVLRQRLAVSAADGKGKLLDATGLQIPGVLDELFFYDGPLGVEWSGERPSIAVWAPTASQVNLVLFSEPRGDKGRQVVPMLEEQGVWSVVGEKDWKDRYYQYEVTVYMPQTGKVETNLVTDPYSRALSRDSQRTQIVNMQDERWLPDGWQDMKKPDLEAPEDIVLYELHVRDFSTADQRVPEKLRGTYGAFSVGGHGRRHLESLAKAGLTHVHLLPVYDLATTPENPADQKHPGDLSRFAPDSPEAQAAIWDIRNQDSFNWGYDPWHYGVPEGSYAVNPDGGARLLEFRTMVKALSEMGLRVVMDVVYNHTFSSGLARESVFDRIVPGYYHRLDADGKVATSTCCKNTASEHRMMERLIRDDLVHWARNMKIDGFRFDLMGHHMRSNMEEFHDALQGLTMERDGVDGRAIYLYGEGWDFGEVQGGKRGRNATQANLAGTGIGTFNDRIRDAVRGGSPFSDRREQGFATGLVYRPNGRPGSDDVHKLMDLADRIRVGLTGNLRDFRQGRLNGGSLGGYTSEPQEAVQYISAHDNETFFDKIALAMPTSVPMRERAARQQLALSVVALAQGVPFFHAGSELLRSKSMDADSYNSGDWFNRLDFSGETTTWGAGLPVADKNRDRWEIMKPLLRNEDLAPDRHHILQTAEYFKMLLKLRKSSPLFRLRTAEDVKQRVHFHNLSGQGPAGLIVMQLRDVGLGLEDLDPDAGRIFVLFNPAQQTATFGDGRWKRLDLKLHPLLKDWTKASFDQDKGLFAVPPHSMAVFVGE
jgi:pullulanase